MALRFRQRADNQEREQEKLDPTERAELVRDLVRVVASEQNDALADPLLDEAGRIDQVLYGPTDPDDETELADRQRFIRAQKDEWLGLTRSAVRAALATEAGLTLDGLSEADQIASVREYAEQKQERKDGSVAEGVIATMFHRAFGQEYVVARTNEWDDFQHGADMMLVNRTTGEVVCAFDDVATIDDARRKADKIDRLNTKGGTRLEYGITFRGGQLIKERRRGIPAFYLQLGPEDLEPLVRELHEQAGLGYDGTKILGILMSDLDRQAERIINGSGPAHIKQAATTFREGALKRMSRGADGLRREAEQFSSD